MNRPWVVACTVAEAIGMTAAAGAAKAAAGPSDDQALAVPLGLTVVVAGGVVEGAALGWLQARALADVIGPRGRRAWLVATVLVAGFGWAAGSVPAVLAGDSTTSTPSLVAVLPGAALLGAAMGAVLGAAQAWALRRRVVRAFRWVLGSTVGWTAAMPVIFAGAATVGRSWAWWLVVSCGTATGALAGAALGLTTGPFIDALTPAGQPQRSSHEPAHVA